MQTMFRCLDDNAIAAYVDGVLTADEVTRIDLHLSECAECRRDLSAVVVVMHYASSLQSASQ